MLDMQGRFMGHSYYSKSINEFLKEDDDYILGVMAHNNQFPLTDLQRNAWIEEINGVNP